MSVRSLNKVMLIGNLTKDPVVRYTPTGTAVASFSIATNSTYTPKDGGEKQEKTEFHNIVAWSKLAELCGQFLHKGDKAYLEGRLQTRDWKTNEGQDRRTTEIVLDNMIMLGGGRGGSYSGTGQGSDDGDSSMPAATPAKPKRATAKKNDDVVPSDDVDAVEDISDDIPF